MGDGRFLCLYSVLEAAIVEVEIRDAANFTIDDEVAVGEVTMDRVVGIPSTHSTGYQACLHREFSYGEALGLAHNGR